MRAADKRAFVAITVFALAAGCFDDPAGGPHPCDSCLACESCVEGPDGPTCAAASQQSQTCVGDEIHWLDSCGDDEGSAEACPAHSTCEDDGAGAATCVCTNEWTGADCDVCPGNWDPAQDCAACAVGYDPATGCAECLPNWSAASDCTACDGNWDVEQDCLVCENHWVDEGNDCGSCPDNWDAAEDCDACQNHWIDEGNDCGTCPGNWDADADCDACQTNWEGDDCDLCPGNWNPLANCATCWFHWIDEDNDCGTCPGNWNAAEDCVACLGNWDIGSDCTACLGNWDEASDCTVCLGNWDEASDCVTCLGNWDEASDCVTCLGNWDEASDCVSCLGNWDIVSDCTTCLGGWDEVSGCTTCLGNWDETSGCTACLGNWDETSDCTACDAHWEGADCDVCSNHWTGTSCETCPGNWDPAADCDTCENQWIDEGNDCGTCPGNWDPAQDCADCLGAFDPASGCTVCAPGWSGAACDVQDLCVRYTDVDSPAASPTGYSWATAFPHLQDAIDAAFAVVDGGGATSCQVWVAAGTYAIYETGIDDTVQLRSGVELYGGFNGTEAALDNRDFEANATVLDGAHPELEFQGVAHVVTGADDAHLDGFVIANGYATFPAMHDQGGGLYLGSTSPHVANCVFENNFANGGGAVYGAASAAIFEDCVFRDNRAEWGAGAVFDDQGGLSLIRCSFDDNGVLDGWGAAVGSSMADTTIRDCLFTENHVWSFDATYGGAVFAEGDGQPVIENSIFVGNIAAGPGAAIYSGSDHLAILGCTFYGNRSNRLDYENLGGALYFYTTSSTTVPIVRNSILWHNVPAEIVVSSGSAGAPDVRHSIVEGGYAGVGNADADPLFVDPENSDFRLDGTSPAIDAADGMFAAELDFLGGARFDHPGVADAVPCGADPDCVAHADLGAIEYPFGKCAGHWDPYADCATCADLWTDAGDDCGTCPAHADAAGGCRECLGNWDPATDCATCRNHWLGADCGSCPGNWSAATDCAQCSGGYDPATGCTGCLPGWSGVECGTQSTCVRYVDLDSAAANPNGKSWSQAFRMVQEGIDAAHEATLMLGGDCDVWVAAGTYYIYRNGPEDTVLLRMNTLVYGGFLGDETEREQRDASANATVLDGNKDWANTANVYHVVTGSPESTFDGFRVTGGVAKKSLYDSGPSYDNVGGGMVNQNASVMIRDCVISNNAAMHGASLANFDSTMVLENTVLVGGSAHTDEALGAAIYNDASYLEMVNCTTTIHQASSYVWPPAYYPAIYNVDGEITVGSSVLWDDGWYLSPEITNVGSGTTYVEYSDVYGGHSGTGNKNSDPLFDFEPRSLPELSAGSPCIDAANAYYATGIDFDGDPAVDDPSTPNTGIGPPWVDMGAFEYQP